MALYKMFTLKSSGWPTINAEMKFIVASIFLAVAVVVIQIGYAATIISAVWPALI